LLSLAYNVIPLSIFALILLGLASLLKKRRKNRIPGSSDASKKKWFRKKSQTVGDMNPSNDFIPPSSEDK
ncbi:MAG: hypothetical protein IIX88_05015, partial [Firmicutes bacterium]|nr:hypothetical protein [Bacillota bacterium]